MDNPHRPLRSVPIPGSKFHSVCINCYLGLPSECFVYFFFQDLTIGVPLVNFSTRSFWNMKRSRSLTGPIERINYTLPDTLLSHQSGILRTHSWLFRDDALRISSCQRARYHCGDEADVKSYERLLRRRDSISRPVAYPDPLLRRLENMLPPAPRTRKQRQTVANREKRFEILQSSTDQLLEINVESDGSIFLDDKVLRSASVRSCSEFAKCLRFGSCFLSLSSNVPFPHRYKEVFLK